MDLNKNNLIPKPVYLEATCSSFKLSRKTIIYVDSSSEELLQTGQYLAEHLRPSTGFKLPVKIKSKKVRRETLLLDFLTTHKFRKRKDTN